MLRELSSPRRWAADSSRVGGCTSDQSPSYGRHFQDRFPTAEISVVGERLSEVPLLRRAAYPNHSDKLAAEVVRGEGHERRRLDEIALGRARRIIDLAWKDVRRHHKLLLQNVGAHRWEVADAALGGYADDLLQSAGHGRMTASQQAALDQALGVWIDVLRVVLIDAGHREYAGLDDRSYEAALVRVAWHEWAHALGVVRATADDAAAGPRLLDLAPEAVRDGIRRAGYRHTEYTHELIAEVYALLMARRRRGQVGQPPWLDDEIYELVRRVCGWSQ